MNQQLQTNLIDMKNIIVSEVQRKHGIYCEVQLRELHTKRLDTLVRVSIIPQGNPFNAQQFDVYQDRKGTVYWDNAVDIREDESTKDIN